MKSKTNDRSSGTERKTKKRRFRFPHIGMRTVKTVVAVFLCCVIDYLRGAVPVQSTIAAVLCIQPDTHNSIKTAVTRIVGTIMGGLAAALMLTVFKTLGWPLYELPFYLVMSLLLFILIFISVQAGFPEATALTCIVYLVISLSYTGWRPPFKMAIERVLDTLLGIVVAVPVNLLLPTHRGPDTAADNTQIGVIAGRITQALDRRQRQPKDSAPVGEAEGKDQGRDEENGEGGGKRGLL